MNKDDIVTPFIIEDLHIKGRIVQLGPELDSIITRHNYPEAVSHLLAQMIALTALIGSSLKMEGKFSIQTTSNGAVNLLVCNFITPHNLRAYARYNMPELTKQLKNSPATLAQLLGQGSLAFTMETGHHTKLYQGIVELSGNDLAQLAEQYYISSEQISTKIKLTSHFSTQTGWRAGGLFLQYLPHKGADPEKNEWNEANILAQTLSDEELLDKEIGAHRLLFRLFHEHEIRVFNEQFLQDKCSCSREKISEMLQGFDAKALEEMVIDNKITVQCQFCSQNYDFQLAEISTPES
ncbi:Hsp33 family molecular chaperone HslO [Bartonella sp. TP]|uniref:Hsp33 family molecular chaperone HslO n=1 Tax=Bartonella sp. TP TaxID=3057550 RepID=UPI0025B203AE|nr:Hsp33 family molecular chaperone HslO [Bartonella sp. TP]MDN5248618.1 Hsp33 family molecular chaperone HslO [Alphaproteobacteria bacterium]WJW80427.1 Hsp33 family molecular chaperone HslO [Bartonella sp. TP]